MFPAGFEPTIPAIKRPQTHILDRAATGIGHKQYKVNVKPVCYFFEQFERKFILSSLILNNLCNVSRGKVFGWKKKIRTKKLYVKRSSFKQRWGFFFARIGVNYI
jgi:hypothetical protein